MKKLISIIISFAVLLSAFSMINVSAAEGKTYYLFGWINGDDYACEKDAQNMGEYRFVNNQVTVNFSEESYVAVKEEGNVNWYMTNGWQGKDVTSVTLYNTNDLGKNADKMYIPPNVEITLYLTDNGDGSLTLWYNKPEESNARDKLMRLIAEYSFGIVDMPEHYTPESYMAFMEAYSYASKLLSDSSATDAQYEEAYARLLNARSNLVSANLTIEEARAYLEITIQRASSPSGGGTFTKESMEAYQYALGYARDMYYNDYATANQLMQAAYELMDAYNNLELFIGNKEGIWELIEKLDEILARDDAKSLPNYDELKELYWDAYMTYHYADSQEKLDECRDKLKAALSALEETKPTNPTESESSSSQQPSSTETDEPSTTEPDVTSTAPTESETPNTDPTESETPSTAPTESETPNTDPTESETPSTAPTESETPSTAPTESGSPSTAPTESGTPITDPTESETPSTTPTESETPSTDPTESETPSTAPTEGETPSTTPTEGETPSTTPTESETPSINPTESETPSESSTPTEPETPPESTTPTQTAPTEPNTTTPETQTPTNPKPSIPSPTQPSTIREPSKGSTFNLLQVKNTSTTKNSITLKYKKPSGTKSFVIYGAQCGKKYKVLKTTNAKSINIKNLKKGKYYKFFVVALSSKGKVVATSKTIHVATKGGRYGNPNNVTIKNASSVKNLENGKSVTLKTKVTATKGVKFKTHRKVKFESSDTKIIKVNSKGKVTAKKKGIATIYAYAQNGVMAKVKITVK